LFLFQRRQVQFFCWACGNVLFGFRLFEKQFVELVALTFLFRVGLAHFLLELDFRGVLLGFRSFCGRGGDRDKFVELVRLNFCVGVALSGSAVGLSQFCV
jgi:hypothetical protein